MNVAATSRRCLECGAIPRESDSKFCSYCGAELPVLDAPAPETPAETTVRRFERLREHPDARRALASRPSGRGAVAKSGGNVAGALLGLGAIGAFVIFFMSSSGASRSHTTTVLDGFGGGTVFHDLGPAGPVGGGFSVMFTLVPLMMLAMVIFAVVRAVGRSAEVARAPVRSRLALVVDEHREDRGHGEHRRSVHVATFEDERGARSSFEVSTAVARSLAPGDMGVLHSKGPAIVRFERVDV